MPRRIGELHQRAKLTDADVSLVLALREKGLTYRAIAAKFDGLASKSGIAGICQGRTRAYLTPQTNTSRRNTNEPTRKA